MDEDEADDACGLEMRYSKAKRRCVGTVARKTNVTGILLVNSYPYAKCTVRGVTKGVPAKFVGIPATCTRVTCRKGFVNKTKSIRVKANKTVRLNFKPDDYKSPY